MNTHRTFLLALAALLFGAGCSSVNSGAAKPEKGPQGTIAYLVEIEASEPGVRIEADSDSVGTAPLVLKIFADKDGTFHNFGSPEYVIRAIPADPTRAIQTKVFRTGGWFTPEDRVPKKIFFEMSRTP